MSISPGTRLGQYEVGGQLGVGGMGEVYRATDTKLKREVAVKVLPDSFAQDPERLARFQREAEVLASLNHPNIAAIYGLEDSGETRALILELVEGPTLQDRISQGAIPLDEALPIAKQIAEALEAAHEQGIIHRDLKPANIKVTPDGVVKVLDFGLAKALEPEVSEADAANSPTMSMTAAATRAGFILGTAAYMSPEQARGETVGPKADIWAFGVVLLEMLTGNSVFVGKTVSDTLAFVLTKEPDWTSLPSSTPAAIRRLLRRCLHKEPKQRLSAIGDARLDIDDARAGSDDVTPAAASVVQPALWQRPAIVSAALALALLAGGLGVRMATRPDVVQADLMRFVFTPQERLTFSASDADLVISADGRQVVHSSGSAGQRQLHLRPMDQLDGALLPGTGDNGGSPFISPDGQWIGFRRDATLLKVSILGGPEVTLTESPASIRGASWGSDDQIIFGTNRSGLFRVSGRGGDPEALTTVATEQGEFSHRWPFIIPDREAVLFVVGSSGDSGGTTPYMTSGQLAVLDLNTGETTRLALAGVSPRYVSTGHLVYAVPEGSVWAVPFDSASLEVTGNPVPLVEGVMVKTSGAANFSISDNGRLVFVSGGAATSRTLSWVDRDGGLEPLPALVPANYRSVDVSPDGNNLALELAEAGGEEADVWIHNLARGTLNRLTTDPAEDQTPLWTQDGRQVVFGSNRDGAPGIYRRNADGSGETERLFTARDAQDLIANSWSPDGETLVVVIRDDNQNDLAHLSVADEPALTSLTESDVLETRADLSPDGNWIAYSSTRSGRNEIYVERFPDLGARQLISTDGGRQPRWSPDGRELFYLTDDASRVMVVPIEAGIQLSVGIPDTVIEGLFWDFRGRSSYDVAPDGRLVIIRRGAEETVGASPGITVAINWFEELKARVPVP